MGGGGGLRSGAPAPTNALRGRASPMNERRDPSLVSVNQRAPNSFRRVRFERLKRRGGQEGIGELLAAAPALYRIAIRRPAASGRGRCACAAFMRARQL